MNRKNWRRRERDNGPPEEELNVSGPEFARLEPSPANPPGLADVDATLTLAAPRRFLNLLDIYGVPESDLEKLAALYLPFGFAKTNFPIVARFLNIKRVEDIQYLRIHRSRINIHYFNVFQDSFLKRSYKYGIKKAFTDLSLRSVLVVEAGGIGYPSARAKEAVLTSLGVKGLVYVAVDPKAEKKNDSDGAARLLAELAVCNYKNVQAGKWAPMLGILSDGDQFQFWIYSSTARKIWASHWIPGFNNKLLSDMEGFFISLKIVVEYLYDFVLSMVFNTMRIGVREADHAVTNNPDNEELVKEKAELLRSNDKFNEAEREVLNVSKFMVPSLEYWLGIIKAEELPPNEWDRNTILVA
ncbi:uncharacterized protein DFL_001501 [Arthrobotrys flagrans]|uniref:Uncharacterized protein n=1 Tax=Arthrobotrys flagrans TaxID=97331 RepID=A0A437A7T9_ARTFL|nr:hypothetical protein DFL_001501 [Arthrobotrys flagrans]